MRNKQLNKYLLIFFIIVFSSVNAYGAKHYINTACVTACDGSTWEKGWATFGSVTWTRGDTYYVAGGTYNEDVTIPSKVGTSWITVKKANATDNSGDPGWNPSYATTQAVIAGNMSVDANYVEIDGVTGSGTSGHGIKINPSTLTNVLKLDNYAGPYHIHHLELKGNGFAAGATSSDGLYYNLGTKGFHVSYCWIHEVTRNGVTIGSSIGTSYSDYGMLFENNVVSETGGCTNPDVHGQGIQIGYNSTDAYLIIRNNTFRNILGSAMIAYLGGAGANHSNSRIYNNIFYITDLSTYNVVSPGVIWTNNAGGAVTDFFYIYNNTFYGLGNATNYNKTYGRIMLTSSTPITTTEAKNNLWVKSYLPYGGYLIGITSSSNNGFYDNDGSSNPGNTELADPFVNSAEYDFRLISIASAKDNGVDLRSVFTTDILGTNRPQEFAWDIGAYEYSEIETSNQVPALSFSPISISFSGVISGTLSSPKTITLSNTGTEFITISSISLSGTNANQFSIPATTDYCTGETVAASGNCSFQVIFSPTSVGEKTANVNLTSLYYGSPASLPLYGSAVAYKPMPRVKISKIK